MKFRIFFFAAAALAIVAAASCMAASASANEEEKSSSAFVSRQFKIADFSKIEVSQGIKVVFRQAPNPGYASVSASQKNLDRLQIQMDGDAVEISFKNNSLSLGSAITDNDRTEVVLCSPNFESAEIKSGAALKVVGDIGVRGNIEIEAQSAGSAVFNNVACASFDIDCSSSASVKVKSLKGNLDADASSAATLKIDRLRGSKLKAEASSASSVSVSDLRCDLVDVEASSASSVSLSGVCSSLKKESSSAADINCRNLAVRK